MTIKEYLNQPQQELESSDWQQLADEHGSAFIAYCDNQGFDYALADGPDQTLINFEESYQGDWSTVQDYAFDLAHSVFDMDDDVARYFDYDQFAYDLECGDIWTADAPNFKVHVFQVN